MNVTLENVGIIFGIISTSGAVSWSAVRLAMKEYVDWPTHREICHQKSEETKATLSEINSKQDSQLQALSEIKGYIKAKNDDSL
jgi:hypothetical protein